VAGAARGRSTLQHRSIAVGGWVSPAQSSVVSAGVKGLLWSCGAAVSPYILKEVGILKEVD